MRSTHIALFRFLHMPLAARQAHIFPALSNKSIISIGQLCDNVLTATFNTTSVSQSNGSTTIHGNRYSKNDLYYLDLVAPPTLIPSSLPPLQACTSYKMRNKSDVVHYLHNCSFVLVGTTWTKAIDAGYFSTWPGLTSELVCKHLPKSMDISKGHLQQDHQNVRSTKPPTDPPTTPYAPPVCTNKVFAQTIKFTGKVATYQIGRFLVTSSLSSKYIMFLYDHDSNVILRKPINSQSEHKLICTYSALHSNLTERGIRPTFQMLYNKYPEALESFMRKVGVTFQLVPPHLHCTNAVERSIQNFKDHFVADLSSCDSDFPLHLWDCQFPQATLTLNLLHPSRINPGLSTEAQLNGAFDLNKNPLAPPGTKVLIFQPYTTCCNRAPHGIHGWYLGTAP